MCHYLMFLVVLIISKLKGALACHTATPEECRTPPFVPGYQHAGEGYDVVTLERKGTRVFDVYNYLSPTNSCSVCTNPLMDDELQKLPYYMADWHPQSQCQEFIQTSTFTSISSVVESESSVITDSWGIELDLPGKYVDKVLVGSKSKLHSFSSSAFLSDNSSIINVNQFSCTNYRFRASNTLPLSGEFQRDVQSLPLDYTSTPYRRFIDIYGTHYIRQVDLGGRMKKVTSIRTCLASLNSVTTDQVEQCISMGIGVGLGFAKPTSNIMSFGACVEIFNSYDAFTHEEAGFLKHMTEVVGGSGWSGVFSLTTEDSSGFKNWKNSLKDSPDILSFELFPLHELVANRLIRINLRAAIREYIIDNSIPKDDTNVNPQRECTQKPNHSPGPGCGRGCVAGICVGISVLCICLCFVLWRVFLRRVFSRCGCCPTWLQLP